MSSRERSGKPIDALDEQIAAICLVHESPLAARNVKDFGDIGLEVVDPWDPSA